MPTDQAPTDATLGITIDPLLKRPKVEELTGLSTSSIYAEMARGNFPKPVRIASKAVAWRASSIAQWINSREQVAA